jgi:hypothetical protein
MPNITLKLKRDAPYRGGFEGLFFFGFGSFTYLPWQGRSLALR